MAFFNRMAAVASGNGRFVFSPRFSCPARMVCGGRFPELGRGCFGFRFLQRGISALDFRRGTAKRIELVSAQEACNLVQEFFQRDKPIISIKTIYNKVWEKQLKRYGPKHELLLDKQEVLQKLCRHYGK